MPAAQIYSVVNTIANNIGYTGSTVVDVTTFTAFAQAALTGVKESVYSTLYDLIGRTVIAIDEADVIIMVVDCRTGITTEDEEVIDWTKINALTGLEPISSNEKHIITVDGAKYNVVISSEILLCV